MSRSQRDNLIGSTLGGRFRITRPLAEGGMARVYVARDETTDLRVAVKVLVPQGSPSQRATMVKRMEREVVALARLEHPDIVKTLAHGALDGESFFIAMELIEGPDLSEWARKVNPRPEEAIQILLQICSALRHAHRKGVIHRDVKASNILITQEEGGLERAKLIDFGLVTLDGLDTVSESGAALLGSVHTVSPEQVRRETVDGRADMYAVGILAYRLLTGKYPYHSRIAAEVISRHVHAPVPKLEVKNIPYGLDEIVERCMAKLPDDRYADMTELMDELADCLEVPTSAFTQGVATQGANSGEVLDEPSNHILGWAAAAGVAAIGLGLAYFFFFFS